MSFLHYLFTVVKRKWISLNRASLLHWKGHMRIEILGVPVDAITKVEALMKAQNMLAERRGHFLTTPNPEMLVLATREPRFKEVLRKADLAIPDGIGLLYAARLHGKRIPERVSGADFLDELAALALQKGLPVFLLGGGQSTLAGKQDVAKRAADILREKYPGLEVVGAESGGQVSLSADGTWQMDPALLDRIRAASPAMLFVAFGHGKQETWIADHLAALPSVRLAIGIGGAFDFIAGEVRRAPLMMRRLGLEWLWRLVRQPSRFGRIWTAVAVFPWLALRDKNC